MLLSSLASGFLAFAYGGEMAIRDKLSAALGAISSRSLHASPLQAASAIEEVVKKVLADSQKTGLPLPPKDEVLAMAKKAYDAILKGFSNPMIAVVGAFLWPVVSAAISAIYDKFATHA